GFIFFAGTDGITEGTYTFTFHASNGAGGDIDQEVIISVGNSPVWRALPDILVDLDAERTVQLYQYVSGDPIPDRIDLDTNRTAANAATYEYDAGEGYLVIGPVSGPTTNIFTFTAANAYGTASITFTNVIRRLDTDDDGIPDWWAIRYFGGATACNPNLDSDGDGFTNYQEFMLATDPTDASSVFELMSGPGDNPDEVYFTWPSATGTTFTLWSSTNILAGTNEFTEFQTGIVGDQITITNHSPDTTFYYMTFP
ncbi:MAG: hypothetical protein IK066_08040, partial [Kiritimatiellae bacterium]|nr:hypothetical protein [Kiritimatiellia bacterium]